MGRPWGFSGPEFLLAYGVALVVVCVVTALVRSLIVHSHRTLGSHQQPLNLYEWAYLHGGARRVAETALAGLIDSGAARVNRRHRLTATGKPALDDFQQAVLDRIDVSDTVADQYKEFRHGSECDPLLTSLRQQRLICSARARAVMLTALGLFPLLIVINVVRAVNGARLHYPIGGLIFELVITVIAWSIASGQCRHPLRTAAGNAAIRPPEVVDAVIPNPPGLNTHRRPRHRLRNADDESAAVPPPPPFDLADAAARVATWGIESYPDRMVARLLERSVGTSAGGAGGFAAGGGGGHGGGGGGCGGGGC